MTDRRLLWGGRAWPGTARLLAGGAIWGRGTLTHWDACVHTRANTHTHTCSLFCGSSLTLTKHDSLPTPWLCGVGPISVALPGAGWSWIPPGLFPRAFSAAAELLILRGLRSDWKEAAGSWGPEGFLGGQGPTQRAAERVWRLHLSLLLQRNEAVLQIEGRAGFADATEQIFLSTRLETHTNGVQEWQSKACALW